MCCYPLVSGCQPRPLWRHYYANTKVLIFVVDSADKERYEDAKEVLWTILEDENLKNVPILIWANKEVKKDGKNHTFS